ncbi:hypothetical protein THOD04_50319 [Vibrio owensii]|nr:hypothetical protein THOD04_50319 [Vibrio owensii]
MSSFEINNYIRRIFLNFDNTVKINILGLIMNLLLLINLK